MEKALGWLSGDDITLRGLAGGSDHSFGLAQQTDMVAIQNPH